MILIVGGFAAGKRAWAKEALGYSDAAFSRNPTDSAPVLYDLQDLDNVSLEDLLQKEVVICNEVGCGVVPMLKEEREYREQVGRMQVILAKSSESVERVICGIAQKIK